jgi:hypothetical protein
MNLRSIRLLTLCSLVLGCGDNDEDGSTSAGGGAEDSGVEDTGCPEDTAEPAPCEEDLPDPTLPPLESCPLASPDFDPVVLWSWQDGDMGVIVTPAIGDIDGDGISDVAFTAFQPNGTYWNGPGELLVVSGDGSATELIRVSELTDPATSDVYTVSGHGNVTLGDLDADGTPEICVVTVDASVVCVNYTGGLAPQVQFVVGNDGVSTSPVHASTGPAAMADMDHDGLGELVWGRLAFDDQGSPKFASPGGIGSPGGSQGKVYAGIIGQADDDPLLELISSTTPYDPSGGENWYYPWDGMAATADLDLDGVSEVVATYTWWNGGSSWDWFPAMRVALQDGTETHVELVDGDWSGAPTLANFDTDPELEIAVSSQTMLRVYDHDLTEIWSTTINDTSSGYLSSTAVDWDGDGVWELLHADETMVRLFDIDDNIELFSTSTLDTSDHRSGTHMEAPSVADLDGDGSLEIVLASNVDDIGVAGWKGIRVIGSATSSWGGTDRVWNQHAFVADYIEDDLSLPSNASHAAEGFRAARSMPPSALEDLPQITILDAEKCDDCPIGTYYWVVVANVGTGDAGNFVVSAYDGTNTLRYQESVLSMAAGGFQWIGPLVLNETTDLTWVADDFEQIEECDETDNTLSFGTSECP